jgi:hypothetical protein
MTQPSIPTPYEARITIALRKLGVLAIGEVTPVQAAALWRLNLLRAEDIGALANSWLETGRDEGSPEVASIALNPPSSLSIAGPSFEAALAEMGVTIPSLDEPVLVTLELYLRAMIEGRLPPMVAMAAIDDLYENRGDARLQHPNRSGADHDKYLGQELGLEHLYTWYRELQDAEDGSTLFYYNELPKDEQLAKFEEELLSEAKILHFHLCNIHPEVCADRS